MTLVELGKRLEATRPRFLERMRAERERREAIEQAARMDGMRRVLSLSERLRSMTAPRWGGGILSGLPDDHPARGLSRLARPLPSPPRLPAGPPIPTPADRVSELMTAFLAGVTVGRRIGPDDRTADGGSDSPSSEG